MEIAAIHTSLATMRSRSRLVGLLVAVAAMLASCATNTTVVRAVQYESLPPFASARAGLPAQPAGSLRMYIYRPQALVGMWGAAIVHVNGRPLGDPANPVTDNRLIPGAVFVVDVAQGSARVTWSQSGRPEGADVPLSLSAATTPVAYLRWTLRPTHGLLEPASAEQGQREIESLKFSGHVVLDGR